MHFVCDMLQLVGEIPKTQATRYKGIW